jgi:hypothetical protein
MNTISLLPERGIFVPTSMIFHPQLPATVLVTWIQLRCLAWRGWHTSPLSLPELASLTGIHPDRLQRHLIQLEGISALSLHTSGDGKLIITFPEHPGIPLEGKPEEQKNSSTSVPTSSVIKLANQPSYFPNRILGYISYPEEREEKPCEEQTEHADPVSISSDTCISKYLLFRC